MSSSSVRARFIFSAGANVVRAAISFLTGLIVARGLSPAGYGDLTFLLGSFMAIRSLLDMGTSSAFYTLISQRARDRAYYLTYFAWLAIQFIVSAVLVVAILPQAVIDRIWLGQPRYLVLLALAASFLQQSVWTTVVQIGEAARSTYKVQLLAVAVVTLHLLVVSALLHAEWLSVATVLCTLIVEYSVGSIVSSRILGIGTRAERPACCGLPGIIREYWRFCRPLVVLSVVTFLYQFLDRWFLQSFGGASQQGFFQISAQFAALSLLANSSILNIFWKEIAEASARQDTRRVAYLYKRVSRVLFMVTAAVACFMIPWAQQIVGVVLGSAYRDAWPVLAVMFFYPIHQSMGQVNGTMFLARGQTTDVMFVGIAAMVVSIPAAYLLLAPAGAPIAPGVNLGALGLAFKEVGVSVLFVNVQAWLVARSNGWRYEWIYQVHIIVTVLAVSYLAKTGVCAMAFASCSGAAYLPLAMSVAAAGAFYLVGILGLVWMSPSMVGTDRQELRRFAVKCNPLAVRIN